MKTTFALFVILLTAQSAISDCSDAAIQSLKEEDESFRLDRSRVFPNICRKVYEDNGVTENCCPIKSMIHLIGEAHLDFFRTYRTGWRKFKRGRDYKARFDYMARNFNPVDQEFKDRLLSNPDFTEADFNTLRNQVLYIKNLLDTTVDINSCKRRQRGRRANRCLNRLSSFLASITCLNCASTATQFITPNKEFLVAPDVCRDVVKKCVPWSYDNIVVSTAFKLFRKVRKLNKVKGDVKPRNQPLDIPTLQFLGQCAGDIEACLQNIPLLSKSCGFFNGLDFPEETIAPPPDKVIVFGRRILEDETPQRGHIVLSEDGVRSLSVDSSEWGEIDTEKMDLDTEESDDDAEMEESWALKEGSTRINLSQFYAICFATLFMFMRR